MKKLFQWFTATACIMLAWSVINFISTTQGWFLDADAPPGDTRTFMDTSVQRIEERFNGNVSYLLIEDGRIFDEFHASIGAEVNKDTVFGVASLGKWVAAFGVMTLVDAGKIDLDAPVHNYLTRWRLPDSQFDHDGVTTRRLLSHTAGMTDGLGHNGFSEGQTVQPLVEHLTQALDAEPGVSGKVAVGIEPGTAFMYSGGSYNLLQLLVEEVSGTDFETYMQKAVFAPLGMRRTGYRIDAESPGLAAFFTENGSAQPYPAYTSLAATGLYSTTQDMYRFISAHLPGPNGEPIGRGVLAEETLEMMRQPIASMLFINIWGAGPMLFAPNNQGSYIIGHGGKNQTLNTTARFNPSTGNGIVMFQTGNNDALASDIATRWTLWETGNPDMYQLRNLIPTMIKRILIGLALILSIALIYAFWSRRGSA